MQKLALFQERIANTRLDFLHKISTGISKNHAVIVMEDLKVTNMTGSAKGTTQSPGRMVKQKYGLNKSILDQGWGIFRQLLDNDATSLAVGTRMHSRAV